MIQRINLYPPARRKVKLLLSARQAALAVGVAILVVCLCAGALGVLNQRLEKRKDAENARLVPLSKQLEALQAQLQQRRPSALLKARTTQRSLELGRKKELLAWLERSRRTAIGFAPSLEGLARVRVEGIWLQQIRMESSGAHLQLQGLTLAPARLAIYLEELTRDGVFKGTRFKTLSLDKTAQKRGYSFLLDSKREGGAS